MKLWTPSKFWQLALTILLSAAIATKVAILIICALGEVKP